MNRILLGRALDPPLDEQGEGQARVLAARLFEIPELIVESSPRRRARHTAGIIAAMRDTVVRIAPQMDELDFGSWSGQSFAELAGDPQWRRWHKYRAVSRTPAGESIRDVQERAFAHLRKLAQISHGETAVVVTHAEVIRSIVLLARQTPLDDYARIEILPASMTRLTMEGDQLRLETVNERVAA